MTSRAPALAALLLVLAGCVKPEPAATTEAPPACPEWATTWCAPATSFPPCDGCCCPPCPPEADCVRCICPPPMPPLLGEFAIERALDDDADGTPSLAVLRDGRIVAADARHLLVRDWQGHWDERALPTPALGQLRAPQALAQGDDLLVVGLVALAERPLGILLARSGDAGETWLETRTLLAHAIGPAPPTDLRASVTHDSIARLVIHGADGILRLVNVHADGATTPPEELWASDGGTAHAGPPLLYGDTVHVPYVRHPRAGHEPPTLGVAMPDATRLEPFPAEGGIAPSTWPTLSPDWRQLRIHWIDAQGAARAAAHDGTTWNPEPPRGQHHAAAPTHTRPDPHGPLTTAWTDDHALWIARNEQHHEARHEERHLADHASAPALAATNDGRAVVAWTDGGALLVALER